MTAGKGVYLAIEVENVDEYYKQVKNEGVAIEIELRNEPWGDRHFAIVDPNGIGIDIVTYTKPRRTIKAKNIGVTIECRLNEIGVYTSADLAELTPKSYLPKDL